MKISYKPYVLLLIILLLVLTFSIIFMHIEGFKEGVPNVVCDRSLPLFLGVGNKNANQYGFNSYYFDNNGYSKNNDLLNSCYEPLNNGSKYQYRPIPTTPYKTTPMNTAPYKTTPMNTSPYKTTPSIDICKQGLHDPPVQQYGWNANFYNQDGYLTDIGTRCGITRKNNEPYNPNLDITPITSSPITSSPITSSPSGINIIQFLKNSGRNLIALGDSLTQGYIPSKIYHPYTIKLSQKLPGINILNMGVSGNRTDQMYFRLTGQRIPTLSPALMPDDNTGGQNSNILQKYPNPAIVIILAGTNDLFSTLTNDQIISNIKLLHTTVLNKSTIQNPIYTIAMTIPQNNLAPNSPNYGTPFISNFDTNRKIINIGIRNMVNNSQGKIFLVDLDNICDQTVTYNAHCWSSDYTHFDNDGYDVVGDKIYNALSTFTPLKI